MAFVLNVVHRNRREQIGKIEETTLNQNMFKQHDFLIDVSKLLNDLLKPNQAVNDSYVVSLVLSLLDAFDQRDQTLVQIS